MTCRVARKWWSSQSGSLWHHRCCHSLAELDPLLLPRDGSGQIMPSEDIKLPFYMERVKDPREFGGIYVYIVTSSTSRGKDERKLSRWKNEIRRDWVCHHFLCTTMIAALCTKKYWPYYTHGHQISAIHCHWERGRAGHQGEWILNVQCYLFNGRWGI